MASTFENSCKETLKYHLQKAEEYQSEADKKNEYEQYCRGKSETHKYAATLLKRNFEFHEINYNQ